MIRGEGKANKTRGERRCGVRGSFGGFEGEGGKNGKRKLLSGYTKRNALQERIRMMSDAGCPLLLTGAGRTGRQDNIYIFLKEVSKFHANLLP